MGILAIYTYGYIGYIYICSNYSEEPIIVKATVCVLQTVIVAYVYIVHIQMYMDYGAFTIIGPY